MYYGFICSSSQPRRPSVASARASCLPHLAQPGKPTSAAFAARMMRHGLQQYIHSILMPPLPRLRGSPSPAFGEPAGQEPRQNLRCEVLVSIVLAPLLLLLLDTGFIALLLIGVGNFAGLTTQPTASSTNEIVGAKRWMLLARERSKNGTPKGRARDASCASSDVYYPSERRACEQ